MSNSLVLHQTPIEELLVMIGNIVAEQLKSIQQPPLQQSGKTILTRKETAEMLGVSLPTLNEWTKTGVVKGTRISSRVRYRLADVEVALQDIKSVKYQRK